MKFSQMKYERPDAEQLKAELNGLTEKLKVAKSYAEAKELFLAEEKLNKHISTLANLAHIRHTIDTRDPFYDGEMKFWNKDDREAYFAKIKEAYLYFINKKNIYMQDGTK